MATLGANVDAGHIHLRWLQVADVAVFWGVRMALLTVLDVHAHLTAWWLKAGVLRVDGHVPRIDGRIHMGGVFLTHQDRGFLTRAALSAVNPGLALAGLD